MTTATGVKVNSLKGMGRGNDDFGSATTTTHADDAFARAGDYDLENVYDRQRQHTVDSPYYERVRQNIDESKKAREASGFNKHTQRERELNTGLDFNHFVGGDINNKSGKVTGGHSLTQGDVRVVTQTSAPDQNGVYQATVEIRTPNGNWELKTNRSGKPMTNHSMFPAHWDEAKIRSEVTSAWENRTISGNKWEGQSKSGVWIEGHITPRGTAYPIYGK